MRRVQLLSIQVGLPQILNSQEAIGPDQTEWTSAFFKQPVTGPIWVGKTNITGDRQAASTHGGPDKAVCVYPWEHYAYWKSELNLPELIYGAFGENLTLQGQLEEQACIGDSVAFGEVVLQITQPRPPCWRLARWWQRKEFAARMDETGLTGWYCRVTKEGYVEAGTEMALLERPYPEWTVSEAHRLGQNGKDPARIEALASCSLLSTSWRETLLKRSAKLREISGEL